MFLYNIKKKIYKTLTFNRCFTTITYSADGQSILAGGRSKNVCIYNVQDGILLKKFEITQNHSLDGLNVRIFFEHKYHLFFYK